MNACRDELRRRSKVRELQVAEWAEDAGPERLAEADELAGAIARLSPDHQVVLGLRYGQDMTVPQIASATGLSEGTVKSRLHHSLKNLKSALAVERVLR